ncbi:MAG: hypothetical protein EXS60_01915 [Candidatus Pacebacteria bacterium]|nr:hypothetical protein [Candidatus Paceibacterota bacterium]
MKKIIIAIVGIVVMPAFAFAQGGYDQYWKPMPARPSVTQPRVSTPTQEPQTTPTIKPKIEEITQITGGCEFIEDKKAPGKSNKKKGYYNCITAEGVVIKAESQVAIDVVNAAIKAHGALDLFFDPNGNPDPNAVNPAMMRTAPKGTVPSPIDHSAKPSGKPRTNPREKPSSGSTDSGRIQPIPEPDSDKVKPTKKHAFELVPVDPPEGAKPSSNPEVEANNKVKEDRVRLKKERQDLRDILMGK